MHRLSVIAVAGLAACALAVYFLGVWTPYTEARTIARGAADFKELSDRFAALAERKGAEYAFEVLRRTQFPPQTDLHLLGHVVGDELYKQKGIEGIAVCTQDFRNACSHSIVIGALDEYGGEEALGLVRDACEKAPGGPGAYTMCYHGLGHGVFAFFGYDLTPTVAFCEKTGTERYHEQEYTECVGGAIMELMGGGGHDREAWLTARVKYLSEDNPLLPCMSGEVPDQAKALCLVYLTPRLLELAGANLGNPDQALFPKALAFCDAIPASEQELRDACFGGFGKEFVPLAGKRDIRRVDEFTDQEYKTAIGWCLLAESDDGRRACIADAVASVFWGGENDPEASFRFCKLAEGVSRDACYKRLAEDIGRYAQEDIRSDLCSRIPADSRGACVSSGS